MVMVILVIIIIIEIKVLPIDRKSIESATKRLLASGTAIASSNLSFITAFSHSFNFLEASGSFGQIFLSYFT